ncbi:MAG: hypothetical protein J6R85_04800 [Lentisphaeria bacterium]|nr:hypothetical protein [Lentisphaeria bacterium]
MKTEFAGILQGFRRDITVYGQNFGQFPADRFTAAGCKDQILLWITVCGASEDVEKTQRLGEGVIFAGGIQDIRCGKNLCFCDFDEAELQKSFFCLKKDSTFSLAEGECLFFQIQNDKGMKLQFFQDSFLHLVCFDNDRDRQQDPDGNTEPEGKGQQHGKSDTYGNCNAVAKLPQDAFFPFWRKKKNLSGAFALIQGIMAEVVLQIVEIILALQPAIQFHIPLQQRHDFLSLPFFSLPADIIYHWNP